MVLLSVPPLLQLLSQRGATANASRRVKPVEPSIAWKDQNSAVLNSLNSNEQHRRRLLWVLAGGIVLLGVYVGYVFVPALVYQNMGWLQYAQHQVGVPSASLEQAQRDFARSLTWNQGNTSAWRGQALTAARQEQKNLTLDSWPRTKLTPEQIVEYGTLLASQKDRAAALLTYQAAMPLFSTMLNPATYAAGGLCQSSWADLASYSLDFATYCHRIHAENDGNLLFNAQFVDAAKWGWDGHFFFDDPRQSQVIWAEQEGHPQPSAAIMGIGPEAHFGIYQSLCLAPGTTVRFSGWFRADMDGPFQARLLYIGWTQDNRPQGNHAQIIQEQLPWTYFEREFTLLPEAGPMVSFYPADVTGQGTIWFDDLRVEIVPPAPIGSPPSRIC